MAHKTIELNFASVCLYPTIPRSFREIGSCMDGERGSKKTVVGLFTNRNFFGRIVHTLSSKT